MDAQRKSRAEVDRKRNGEVLRDLLDTSEPVLRRQARKQAELATDAEEALQSAFALFIERYRGDCDPLAWLQTTVKREAWRIARKASRQRELSSDDLRLWIESIPTEAQEPGEQAIRAEEDAERAGLLRELKPDQLRALLLVAAGYSHAEIACLDGWTLGKVHRSTRDGRAVLRKRGANS
jgi:RNA polymerase sigma factor (sigma-70 family)